MKKYRMSSNQKANYGTPSEISESYNQGIRAAQGGFSRDQPQVHGVYAKLHDAWLRGWDSIKGEQVQRDARDAVLVKEFDEVSRDFGSVWVDRGQSLEMFINYRDAGRDIQQAMRQTRLDSTAAVQG